MITILTLGIIATLVLLWWFFIEPIKAHFERMYSVQDDIRNLELRAARAEKAIKSHDDDIHRMQDRYGNILNHLPHRVSELETHSFGQSWADVAEAENSNTGQVLNFSTPQRANMEGE